MGFVLFMFHQTSDPTSSGGADSASRRQRLLVPSSGR